MIERRTVLAGAMAMASLRAAPSRAQSRGYTDVAFGKAIVIDGLGGFGDPYGTDDAARFTVRGAAELRQSGASAVNFTVNEVGNEPGSWDKTIANIAQLDQIVADNGDLLLRARSAADIHAAKASRRIAWRS
jgi:membrane dipeptidase